jgi:FlaA1/EpsC-like NDP-sugar epimerase
MANHRRKITIIGAGLAGISIAKEIRLKGIFGRIVTFLDDDPAKIGKKINGIPILGPIEDVVHLIKPSPEDEALIAIPSGSRDQLQRIYRLLREAGFSRIRILPGLSQILDGEAHFILTREINPEDFLTRDPVKVSLKESLAYVRGKRVLITGAGGSIGSELSRQLLSGGAERLYLFGHGENSIYSIDHELRLLQEEGVGEKATVVPVIGELKDRQFMFHILRRLRADVVFHSAAYKHVPLMEANPVATINNNVFGTKNLIDAAVAAKVKQLVMISTDKAVDPCSIYGASKYIAEELVFNRRRQGQHYVVVRFGNVLGSRGSILPKFTQQILKGGPLTLTDPEASRYFMTIPEAASLVLKAGGINADADLLILDMGSPLVIRELAEQMIHFYGYQPDKDIKIVYTGLRPGEKLTEKLWSDAEIPEPTKHDKILCVKSAHLLNGKLDVLLEKLRSICFFDENQEEAYRNRRLLKEVLGEYIPSIRVPKNEPLY